MGISRVQCKMIIPLIGKFVNYSVNWQQESMRGMSPDTWNHPMEPFIFKQERGVSTYTMSYRRSNPVTSAEPHFSFDHLESGIIKLRTSDIVDFIPLVSTGAIIPTAEPATLTLTMDTPVLAKPAAVLSNDLIRQRCFRSMMQAHDRFQNPIGSPVTDTSTGFCQCAVPHMGRRAQISPNTISPRSMQTRTQTPRVTADSAGTTSRAKSSLSTPPVPTGHRTAIRESGTRSGNRSSSVGDSGAHGTTPTRRSDTANNRVVTNGPVGNTVASTNSLVSVKPPNMLCTCEKHKHGKRGQKN